MAKKFNLKNLNLGGILSKNIGGAGGAYAAIKANKISALATMLPWKRGLIKMGVGVLVPILYDQLAGKGKKDDLLKSGIEGLGVGMFSIGGIEVGSKFDTSLPVIAGTDPVMGNVLFDESYTNSVSGTGRTMGGVDRASVVNM